MKIVTYKLIFVFLIFSVGLKAQLPIVDISTSDIRTVLGLTGETTFQAMCTASNVNSAGLNATYCSGVDAAARLTNLRSTPYDIGKFRGYDHNAIGCNLSATPLDVNICGGVISVEVVITSNASWTASKTGSNNITMTPIYGSGSGSMWVEWNGLSDPESATITISATGCTSIVISVFATSIECGI